MKTLERNLAMDVKDLSVHILQHPATSYVSCDQLSNRPP